MRQRNAVTAIRGRKQEGTGRKKSTERAVGGETAAPRGVRITHPDRVVYPDKGIRKLDVAEYYRAVMPRLLREIAGRPLSILRCPDGTGAACFFQKHPADRLGSAVKSISLREKGGGSDRYLYVDDARGVLELVQMNTIEFHPWGARVDDPEKPDRLVFDLDPAPGVGWASLVVAAKAIRAELKKSALEGFPRLSGGKGLHVVVPFRRGPSWDQAKAFCETLAKTLAGAKPDLYLATASKAQREGRIFIDWLRNTRGATSVASWSLRAREGAPVAMPLRWDELAKMKSPAVFDLAAAAKRAKALRTDPWPGFATTRQSLPVVSSRR